MGCRDLPGLTLRDNPSLIDEHDGEVVFTPPSLFSFSPIFAGGTQVGLLVDCGLLEDDFDVLVTSDLDLPAEVDNSCLFATASPLFFTGPDFFSSEDKGKGEKLIQQQYWKLIVPYLILN